MRSSCIKLRPNCDYDHYFYYCDYFYDLDDGEGDDHDSYYYDDADDPSRLPAFAGQGRGAS